MHSAPRSAVNLERKCRCDRLEQVRTTLADLGARREEMQAQRDIYYRAAHGRLKLRIMDADHAELIGYERPDSEGVRASSYQRLTIPDWPLLHAILGNALGVRHEVRKRREVWHWHNVRIHLDEVEQLGTFIEFEAVIDDDNDEAISLVRLENLGNVLGLDPGSDVAGSYVDMVEG